MHAWAVPEDFPDKLAGKLAIILDPDLVNRSADDWSKQVKFHELRSDDSAGTKALYQGALTRQARCAAYALQGARLPVGLLVAGSARPAVRRHPAVR